MDDNKEVPCFADELRDVMFKWLHHRDNIVNNLAPQYRASYKPEQKNQI